jgi:integrase
VQRLWDLLATKYERCSLARLLRYLSARDFDPQHMDEARSAAFLAALKSEGRLRIKPEVFHQSSIRAWNNAAGKYAGWPQVRLHLPRYKVSWTTPWSGLPPSLEAAVDRFLTAGRDCGVSVFDVDAPRALKPSTIDTQRDHVRCAASALARAGIPASELTDLRAICAPERFRLALEPAVAMRRGRLGGYVMVLAWTLAKFARYSGSLSPSEIGEVNQLYKRLGNKRSAERPQDVDRDDLLLSQLDDPRVLDALLSHPSRTVETVLKSKKQTRAAALEVQKACVLELWLCAPLRLGNFAALRLDEHFHRLRLDGGDRIVIRIPGREVKNGEPLEHYLSSDAAALLDLYVQDFRPLLTPVDTPWLLPGYGNGHKADAVLSAQMKKFINRATGIDFHPHLIRKITTKILLDADPASIEVARRCLGHRDARTTRRAYTQQQQRAAQLRYLDMLEGRRLVALHHGL